MTVKTRGITIWDRMPHPAYQETSATIDVVVSDDFFRHVAQHVSDEPQLWGSFLREDQRTADPERLKESLRAALRQPCVMVRRDPATDRITWHVVSREGACFVLRFDEQSAHVEDCFFIETPEAALHPRHLQSLALKELIARHAPFDAESRRFIIHRVPPGGHYPSGETMGGTRPPSVWFLASPALLPDESLPLNEIIGHAEPTVRFVTSELLEFGQAKLFALSPVPLPPIQNAFDAACTMAELIPSWQIPWFDLIWRNASEAFREELLMRVIQRRTRAWAATLALDATYQYALLNDQATPELEAAMDLCLDALDTLDESIEPHSALLLSRWSPAQRHRWRSMLADDYQSAKLPWLVCEKCLA